MSRSFCAFHHRVYGRIRERAGVGFGIYVLHGRREDDVRPKFLQEVNVGGDCARIGVEVFGVVELSGVYEDADHGDVIFFEGNFDERCVAFMKCSHGGHESHAFALLSQVFEHGGKACLSVNYLHELLFLGSEEPTFIFHFRFCQAEK